MLSHWEATSDVAKPALGDAMAQHKKFKRTRRLGRSASEAVAPLFSVIVRILLVPLRNACMLSPAVTLARDTCEASH